MEVGVKEHPEGVKVVDLTAYLSGPYCAMSLATMGAEVIKIERPKIGDPCQWNLPFASADGVTFSRKDGKDISLLNGKDLKGDERFKYPEGRFKNSDVVEEIVNEEIYERSLGMKREEVEEFKEESVI